MNAEKKYLNICKTIAILFVISVHMKVSYLGSEAETYEKFTKFVYNFGLAGVGVFFFISGYVYNYNVRSFIDMIKRKTVTLIVPCCIAGIFNAILYEIVLNRTEISFALLLKPIYAYVGQYYFWMIFVLFIITYYTNLIAELFILLFAIIYAVLRTSGTMPDFVFISDFFNPIWWSIWFILGKWCGKFKLLPKVRKWGAICLPVTLPGAVYIVYLSVFRGLAFNYFHVNYVIFEILMLPSILGIAHILFWFFEKCKIWDIIGTNSGTLCLYNFPLCAIWGHILLMTRVWYLIVLSPFMVVGTVVSVVQLLKKLKFPQKAYKLFEQVFLIRIQM